VAIVCVFGYSDVDAGRYLWLEGVAGAYCLVWGQMYLLCVDIQVVVL
jgi:hypothetical protein